MRAGYETGTWWVLVVPSGAVAVPPDTDEGLIDRLWAVLRGEVKHGTNLLSAVVDVFTAHAGGIFSAIPAFVAVLRDGDAARIAVRGRVSVRVRTLSTEEVVTGAEVTTWSERRVAAASGADLLLEDPMSGRVLPIVAGVVAASRVTLAFDETPVCNVEPGAAPVPVEKEVSIVSGATVGGAEATVAEASTSFDPSAFAALPVFADDDAAREKSEPVADAASLVAPAEQAVSTDTVAPEPEPEPDLELVSEHTLVSAVTIAPVGETFWDAPGAPAQGDHDGATISLAQLRELRGAAEEVALPVSPPAFAAPPPELSVPVTGLAGAAAGVADASGPRIRMSTGQVLSLDRAVIIGRRPRSTRASGDSMPHLVTVDSPNHDISRSHLELRPEPGACVAIDLHTTNGSTLLRPGQEPVRLHPGEQTIVVNGDVIDLGDGVTVAVEELP